MAFVIGVMGLCFKKNLEGKQQRKRIIGMPETKKKITREGLLKLVQP